MQLSVIGKQLDVGTALKTHVSDSLTAAVAKYFPNPIEANVVISREAHLFRADIQVHAGRGIILKSEGEAEQPYPAFDSACDRIAKRLRRFKRRLRDHHGAAAADAREIIVASQYILGPTEDGETEAGRSAGEDGTGAAPDRAAGDRPAGPAAADPHGNHDVTDDHPATHGGNGADGAVVIAEMTTEIASLTVSEAVMRLELAELPALMFRNRAHGGLNMIYRRPDGHVGWVDPRTDRVAP